MDMKDLMGAATGKSDDNAEGGGLSSVMDMAKDFDMEELEKYKSMSKTELLEELKNSELSETVINFVKGLVDKK